MYQERVSGEAWLRRHQIGWEEKGKGKFGWNRLEGEPSLALCGCEVAPSGGGGGRVWR